MAYTDSLEGTGHTALPTYNAIWVTPPGGHTCQLDVLGHYATGTTSGGVLNSNYYNNTFAAAHYAKALLASAVAAGDQGIAIRMQTGSSDCYYCIVDFGSSGKAFVGEQISGTATDWSETGSGLGAFVNGDTVYFGADISVAGKFYLYKGDPNSGGTLIQTFTGHTSLTGGKAGISTFTNDGDGIQNWEGGDVTAGSSPQLQSWQSKGAQQVILLS